MQQLQARLSESDRRLYSANRDIAHNFGEVMSEVVSRINAGQWDYLAEFAKKEGVTDEELSKTCDALCRFVACQMQTKRANMGEELAASGFFGVSPAARAVVVAYIGTVMLGMHWGGVREATLGDEGPASLLRGLRWHGYKCVKLMRLPLWRRKLYMLRRRLRRAWQGFCRQEYA